MDARPVQYPDDRDGLPQIAGGYRVGLWEQPERPDIDPEHLGWHEMTFDLIGAQDVREVIEWAERKLKAGEGPLSRDGVPVQDREYLVYAWAPRDECWLHIAGWLPTNRLGPPHNLERLRGHS